MKLPFGWSFSCSCSFLKQYLNWCHLASGRVIKIKGKWSCSGIFSALFCFLFVHKVWMIFLKSIKNIKVLEDSLSSEWDNDHKRVSACKLAFCECKVFFSFFHCCGHHLRVFEKAASWNNRFSTFPFAAKVGGYNSLKFHVVVDFYSSHFSFSIWAVVSLGCLFCR